jgi:hypothetical protein
MIDQYSENMSAILKQQTAYGTHSSSIDQNEWQLDLEYSDTIDTGIFSGDIMAIARARFDFQQALEDESGNSLRIRELYWQTYGDNSFYCLLVTLQWFTITTILLVIGDEYANYLTCEIYTLDDSAKTTLFICLFSSFWVRIIFSICDLILCLTGNM